MNTDNPPAWLISAAEPVEMLTAERCHITELLNSADSPQVSLALARVEPGVSTELHALEGVVETYVIRQGQGLMEVNRVKHPVSVGDKVMIAAGLPQRITNTGEEDLEFYCVCTPRFKPECYQCLEG